MFRETGIEKTEKREWHELGKSQEGEVAEIRVELGGGLEWEEGQEEMKDVERKINK